MHPAVAPQFLQFIFPSLLALFMGHIAGACRCHKPCGLLLAVPALRCAYAQSAPARGSHERHGGATGETKWLARKIYWGTTA